MKILLIDDDENALAPLREEIREDPQVDDLKQVGFEKAESTIASFAPDLIVLDLFSGPPSTGEDTGRKRLEQIWKAHFRPVVIYSADPSVVSELEYHNHPFISCIKKGSSSELKVLEAISKFLPLIEVLQCAKKRIDQEFSKALRDVSPRVSEDDQRLRVIERAARRRVAALVDETDSEARPIEPWEQYVFPPVSENLRQGDVIASRGVQEKKAEHYRIVLTPSCDLAEDEGRSHKADNVLVARCVNMQDAMAAIGIDGSPSKRKSRLRRVLNSGFERHVVPLPALLGLIPVMAADLRSLELVPFDDFRKSYEVVASVDSPFREAIAWAYMQTGARPGLPERATKSWAAEAVDSLSSE